MNEFDKKRLEMFVDAVLAILLTILVLEFKVPHIENASTQDIYDILKHMMPAFFSYTISFLTIAALWLDHHVLMKITRKADNTFAKLNLLFIFCLSPLPFTTALAGEYHTNPFALVVVGANYLIMNLMFMILFLYVAKKGHAIPEFYHKRNNREQTIITMIGTVLFGVGIPLAYVDTSLAFACNILAVCIHIFKRVG